MSDEEKRILFQSKTTPEFRFLSNFHLCKIQDVFANTFDSVEHMYQTYKATNREDYDFVYSSKTPAEARTRGQKIKAHANWDEIKDGTMEMCVRFKFVQNAELREMLLATEGFELVEFAPWDKHGSYWGVNKEGKGENKLGKILMAIRDQLLAEKKERDAKEA